MGQEKEEKKPITVSTIIKGGIWLYSNMVAVSIIGYIYWIAIGTLSDPYAVGLASATISFASIIYSIVIIGIPIGMQHFLGKYFGERNYSVLKEYFYMGIIGILLISLITLSILWIYAQQLSEIMNLDIVYIILAGLFVFFTAINETFRSLFVSIVWFSKIFIIDVITSIVKLGVSIYLILIGFGGVGIVLGFIISNIIRTIMYIFYSLYLFSKIMKPPRQFLKISTIKDIINAGSASWLPDLVSVFGMQIGILILFSVQGASNTGIYFLIFMIFNFLLSFPNAFLAILYPVLSGLRRSHEEITARTINIILAFTTPISAFFIIYSKVLTNFFGPNYALGWSYLVVLSLSIPFTCLINGINSFAYALGKYKIVFVIKLLISLTRFLIYLWLVPIFSGLGAAMSFSIGLIPALLYVIYYSKKVNIPIQWYLFILHLFITGMTSIFLWILHVPWFIGLPALLIFDEFLFIKIKLISKQDLKDIFDILPNFLKVRILMYGRPLLKYLFND